MHEIGALKKAVDLCNQIALDNKIESIKTDIYQSSLKNIILSLKKIILF